MPSQYRIQYRWDDDVTNRSQGRHSSRSTSTALRVARLRDGNSHLTIGSGVARGRAVRAGGGDSAQPGSSADADLLWSLAALRQDVGAAAAALDADAEANAGTVSRVLRRSPEHPAAGFKGVPDDTTPQTMTQTSLRPRQGQGGRPSSSSSSSARKLAPCEEEGEEFEPARSAAAAAAASVPAAGKDPRQQPPAVAGPASSSTFPAAAVRPEASLTAAGHSPVIPAGRNGTGHQRPPLGPSLAADRYTHGHGPLERVVLPAGYCVYFAPGQGGTLLQSDPNKGVTTRAGQKILGVIDPAARNVHRVVEEEYALIREVVERYVERQLKEAEEQESHRYRVGGHTEEHRRLLEQLARGTVAEIMDGGSANVADSLTVSQADRQAKPRAGKEDAGATVVEGEHVHDGSWTGRRDLLPISKALTAALPRRDGRQLLVEGAGLSSAVLHQQRAREEEGGPAQQGGPLRVEKLPLTSREEEQERKELQEREKLGLDLVPSLDLARNVSQRYPDPTVVERYHHHQHELGKKAGRRSTGFRFLPRRTVPLQVVSSRSPLSTRRSLDSRKAKTSWRNASDAGRTVVIPLTPLPDGGWLSEESEISHSETAYLSGKPPSPAFQLRDKRAWSLAVSRRGAPSLEPLHPLVSSSALYSTRRQGLNQDGSTSSVTRSDSKMVLNVVLPREEDSPPHEGRVRLCGRSVSQQQHGPPVGSKPCTCSLQYAWPLAGVSPPPAPPPSAPTNPDLLGLEKSGTGQFLFVDEEKEEEKVAEEEEEEDAFEGDDELDSDDEDLDSGHGQSDARSASDSQRLSPEEPHRVSTADAGIAAPLTFGHRFFSGGDFNRSQSSIQAEKSDTNETLPEPIKNPDLLLISDALHDSHQSADISVLSEGCDRSYERAGFRPVKSAKSTTTEYQNTSEQMSVNTLKTQNGPAATLLDPHREQSYPNDKVTSTAAVPKREQVRGLPQLAKSPEDFVQGATSPRSDHEQTDAQDHQALEQSINNDLGQSQGGPDPVLQTGTSPVPQSSPSKDTGAEKDHVPRRRRSPTTCKRAAHCDLLGPDLCPDCDAALQRSQFSVRQSALFPDINVFPKHMVAARRLQRMRGGKRPAFGGVLAGGGGAYAGWGGASADGGGGRRRGAAAGPGKAPSAGGSRWPYVSVVQLDQVVTERDLCRRVAEQGGGDHRPQ